MQNVPHKTLITILREHVIKWRRDVKWSRESVVQTIVERHREMGGITDIVFDPETRDETERREVNADRVFRWLDDETKNKNLLPANFIPSILAAMPIERRMACVSEFLVSIGLGVRMLDDAEEGEPDINDVIQTQLAHGAALQAVTVAIQNPTPENLEAAELHFVAEEKFRTRLRKKIAAARTKAFGKAKSIIHKAFHRNQREVA